MGAAVLTDRIVLVLAAGAVAATLVAWAALGFVVRTRGLRFTAVAALLTATAIATLLPFPIRDARRPRWRAKADGRSTPERRCGTCTYPATDRPAALR